MSAFEIAITVLLSFMTSYVGALCYLAIERYLKDLHKNKERSASKDEEDKEDFT